MDCLRRSWFLAGAGVALALLAVAVYWPALGAGFIWDDDAVTTCPAIAGDAGLKSLWVDPRANALEPHYWPLTYSTFWLERRLWNLEPFALHLDNVLLHAANAALLWALLRRLRTSGAWLAAALFATHPIHAESVAWIVERKDVLSAAMGLGAAHGWLTWVDGGRRRAGGLAAALALTLAALLSKSVAVCLPVILGALAWWRVGRLRRRELVPLTVLAVLTTALTAWDLALYQSQTTNWKLGMTFWDRTALAGRVGWIYAWRHAWPAGLASIYPGGAIPATRPLAWLGLVATLGLVAILWAGRRRWGRGPLAGTIIYLAALAPTSGLAPFGFMLYSLTADRFAYWPGLALATCVGALSAAMLGRLPRSARAAAWVGLSLAMLTPLTALCWRQATLYRDPVALLRRNVQLYPACWGARAMLGAELGLAGRYAEAIPELQATLALRPDAPDATYNLGRALAGAGREAEAIDALRQATARGKYRARAHHDLAVLLSRRGESQAALQEFQQALALAPVASGATNASALADAADAHRDLGVLLADMGRPADALAELGKALVLRPLDAEALNDRGSILLEQGRLDEASRDLQKALAARPGYTSALANLGGVRLAQGDAAGARDEFLRAVAQAPRDAGLRFNLGLALERLGDRAGATAQWREALRLNPSLAPARARLQAVVPAR